MQQGNFFDRTFNAPAINMQFQSASRKTIIGILLILALVAFEIFNFDTTRFALDNVLGQVSFFGITWATILAIAFCAIDFAGLARLFTPERGAEEPRVIWFLTGAWLLGALMNAIMTWWAVSLTLLSHDFGNEVLGRETLLQFVPIFVAGLVMLTRILFIGAFSIAGEHIFDFAGSARTNQPQRVQQLPQSAQPVRSQAYKPQLTPVEDDEDISLPSRPQTNRQVPGGRPHSRPSVPNGPRPMPSPMAAKPRR